MPAENKRVVKVKARVKNMSSTVHGSQNISFYVAGRPNNYFTVEMPDELAYELFAAGDIELYLVPKEKEKKVV